MKKVLKKLSTVVLVVALAVPVSMVPARAEEKVTLTSTVESGSGTVTFTVDDEEVTSVVSGTSVEVSVVAGEGYEIGKVDVNDVLQDASGNSYSASITVEADTKVNVWFDSSDKLTMMQISDEEQAGHTYYVENAASKWANLTDGSAYSFTDVSSDYRYFVFDAGEGNKYNLTKMIMYSRVRFDGRLRYSLYGSDDLDWNVTNSTIADSNIGSAVRFTNPLNDSGDAGRFGGGSWKGNNNNSATTSSRKEYELSSGSYRYIILQADNTNTSSAAEIKFYGTVETSQPTVTWVTDTDSAVAGGKGTIRFLAQYTTDATVESAAFALVKNDGTIEFAFSPATATAFYADVTDIPEAAFGKTCTAVPYVTIDGEAVVGDSISASVNVAE